jgi:hypothetical protein|tara:strand:- start:854 stop:1744 length:891 start_codon:yes stop_codon:yes gene_type:complete
MLREMEAKWLDPQGWAAPKNGSDVHPAVPPPECQDGHHVGDWYKSGRRLNEGGGGVGSLAASSLTWQQEWENPSFPFVAPHVPHVDVSPFVFCQEWDRRIECWFGGLPMPTQSQLGACLGAFALHVGSKLDTAWAHAQILLGRPVPSAGSFSAAGRGVGSAYASGCDAWIKETSAELQLPEFPEFPSGMPWQVPPIPRLVPQWQRLEGLMRAVDPAWQAASPTPLAESLAQPIVERQPQRVQHPQRYSWGVFCLGTAGGAGLSLAAVAAVLLRHACRPAWGARGAAATACTGITSM